MTLKLDGDVFGYLTVLSKAGRKYSGKTYRTLWNTRCVCGNITTKTTSDLRTGRAVTCGCCMWHIYHKEAYISWMGMKTRCKTPTCKDYPRYGGRGITYDPRWENFIEFYLDMGDPSVHSITYERLSLDRIDNNGNYTKENCRWATRSEQQLNKN